MSHGPSTFAGAENPETSAAKAKKCVLLVEDDKSVRRYFEVTLQRAGYRVITAEDGLAAMKLALSSTVDVLITDAVMPHMSGYELARFVKNAPNLSHIPIVLLTGQENRAAEARHEDLIDAFLFKPAKAADLETCLKMVLETRST